jgi:hypothetical protein
MSAQCAEPVRVPEHDANPAHDEQQMRWRYRIEAGRVRFEEATRRAHRRLKRSILQSLTETSLSHILTLPLIYSVTVPLVLLDVWMSLYQRICFPVYGIPRVRRREFIVFDRHYLAYLNAVQKAHCAYCSYANGVLAYVREIIARTEQYWCPIKHARRIEQPHERYHLFADYGDAEGYRRDLPALRSQWQTPHPETSAPRRAAAPYQRRRRR